MPEILAVGLFSVVVTVAVIALFGFVIFKLVKALTGDNESQASSKTYKNTNKSSSVNRQNDYSNNDLIRIDTKLSKYFEKNMSLAIDDNVSLTTSNGKYTNVGQLYLTFGSEKIIRMSEFEKEHPDVYNKIMLMLVKFSKKKDEDVKEEAKPVKEVKKEKVNEKGKAERFIDEINALNDAIPHEEISNGLDQTCQLLKQIDLACKGKEDDKLTKLYDYYLPILVNVLNKYRNLNDSPVHGEEFTTCENELMKTIILINQALKSLYNSLHEYEYMDLNADISTLQSILKKDGLVDDNPFKERND